MLQRDYQLACADATFKAFGSGAKGVLNALATGLGKTVVAGLCAKRMDSMLFIVDREELAFQGQRTLQQMLDRRVYLMLGWGGGLLWATGDHRHSRSFRPVKWVRDGGVEYLGYKNPPDAHYVVAMSQSMIRRMAAWPSDHFNYIIEDECHHSVSATRTKIREHFNQRRGVIGFSATPTRSDNKAAGLVYDAVGYQMSFLDGVDNGWLVPFRSRVVTCNDMDLRDFKGSAEYSQERLRLQTEKAAVIEAIAQRTVAIADGRQTVIFAQTVQQSQQICDYLKSIGERATHVDGKMHRSMRRDRLDQFGARNFQFVCNCALIEEGVDVPGIEVVAMAAPMRSTGRFMQRVGRGSRSTIQLTGATAEERCKQIADSDKPHFTVIDFIGQMDEHSSAMAFSGDLLAGDFSDEERKVAIKLATGSKEPDMRAIIAQAREIVAKRHRKLTPQQENEAARERYKLADRSAQQAWIMRQSFHPYDVLGLDKRAADQEVSKSDQYGRVYEASVKYLRDCHMQQQEIQLLTNTQIVYLARTLRQRAETHAPYPQARRIHACGYDNAGALSKQEANSLTERITSAGYVRPPEDGPNNRYLASIKQSKVGSNRDYIFL